MSCTVSLCLPLRRLCSSSILLFPLRVPIPREITSVEGITEYRLDNGLRVLIFPDDSRPKVTVKHDGLRRLAA